MAKASFKIRNLPNSLAKNQLKNSLEKMDGVRHASVQSGVVKVDYDSRTSHDDIQDKIKGAGNKLM